MAKGNRAEPMTHRATSRRRRSLFRREEGQAAFEFMLILPFFILFILLLVDLGILMYEYVSVSNAVREGARYGAVNCGAAGACDANDVTQRVLDRSGGILTATDTGDVTVGWLDNDGDGKNYGRGDSVVVKVQHSYDFLFFPGVAIDVSSCADMRLEQTDDTESLPSGTGCSGG